MSVIGLNVVYGYDTDFTNMVAPSDAKTRFLDTRKFVSMQATPMLDGSTGTAIIYNDEISPYRYEVRVTQSPNSIGASDID